MWCTYCGTDCVESSIRHICNKTLYEYKKTKKNFARSENVKICGGARVVDTNGRVIAEPDMIEHANIRINVKPNYKVKFVFEISNDTSKNDVLILGIELAHPQPHFVMNDHPYKFNEPPHVWPKKSLINEEISVAFTATDIGQYEMPIMFSFKLKDDKKKFVMIRKLVVLIAENPEAHKFEHYPYENVKMHGKYYIESICGRPENKYKISKSLKTIFAHGLELESLNKQKGTPEEIAKLKEVMITVRKVIEEGLTKDNYIAFFRYLLWWEEVIKRINLKKYNMGNIEVQVLKAKYILLEVPGLAEKRPSLLRGDRVILQNVENMDYIFEGVVTNIDENYVHLDDLDSQFFANHTAASRYNVRFLLSCVSIERQHDALTHLFASGQQCRVFPQHVPHNIRVRTIDKFFNPLIEGNREQRSAVEHIVAGSSGKSPYIVFGPPGTGKTMTIVEAIVQLVSRNARNRVLVCTESNMAADHIALMLLKYNKTLNINNFLLRANSQSREWGSMPSELGPHSNGTSFETFRSVSNSRVSSYRILVTTLIHSAKYSSERSMKVHKLRMSHVFIDEAAQCLEVSALVPVVGLAARDAQLVLAGDPRQLGPVCVSKQAAEHGLGKSLLERLIMSDMYGKDPNYITMLVNNYRSHPDILEIPNALFYEKKLVPLAPFDPISNVSILDQPGGDRAIVFHAVNSSEQRMGIAPSFFNEIELDMLRKYVKALVVVHKVEPEDIGIIAPYIRQVSKMRTWLQKNEYNIEVGTVEAFQGKEKRVILVSTVRANCRLLDYDARYGLGFLVDEKRFNVALTRAKAKLVIIGNPTCLTNDIKWCAYMMKCKEYGSYCGEENEQLKRTNQLLEEIAITRFKKCGLDQLMKNKYEEKNNKADNAHSRQ